MSNVNYPRSALTGARQTMLSWAKVIESFEEVPQIFQESCKSTLEGQHPFPFVVLAPATSGTRHKATDKLLCETNDMFHIWECLEGRIVLTTYPLKTIRVIELGRILLYSWLRIVGRTDQGVAGSSIIPFNTATGRYLEPFIVKMRPASTDPDGAAWNTEKAKFDYLETIDFKFMNYAGESLLRGEKVLCTVWQPQIRERVFGLFGWEFHRTLALKHLAILTDQELIVIGDDKYDTESRGIRHGGIWQYIPIRQIVGVELTDQTIDFVSLSLTLATDDQKLGWMFEKTSLPALQRLQAELMVRINQAEAVIDQRP